MNRSVLLAAYIYISNADEAVRRKKKKERSRIQQRLETAKL